MGHKRAHVGDAPGKVEAMSDYYDGVIPVAMPIIKDNYGVFWGYDGERISVLDKNGELVEGGYWCQSFEAGIVMLENDGYIDRKPEDE